MSNIENKAILVSMTIKKWALSKKSKEAGAILAIETSDKETIKKMTEIVLESITYMERERNVS